MGGGDSMCRYCLWCCTVEFIGWLDAVSVKSDRVSVAECVSANVGVCVTARLVVRVCGFVLVCAAAAHQRHACRRILPHAVWYADRVSLGMGRDLVQHRFPNRVLHRRNGR